MGLWWLEPGWGSACCFQCGANIRASGGDPDWGYCFSCFDAMHNQPQPPEPSGPPCDICGGEAVATAAGAYVCSEACADEAERLERKARRGK